MLKRTAVSVLIALAAFPAGAAARPPDPADTAQSREAAAEPCVGKYRQVDDQGRSCRVAGGLWKVKLPNGSFSLTHGPDPAPADIAGANGQHGVFSLDATSRDPQCATSNAHLAIVAHPNDNAGNMTPALFREHLRLVDGILYHAAVESGSPNGAHFRFICNAGQLRVDEITLNFATAQANFARIKAALQAAGYNSAAVKPVVFWDATLPGPSAPAGQGDVRDDDSDGPANQSNQGNLFSMNYNFDDSVEVTMHEIGHTDGAVQPAAPSSTGRGFHCFQDHDVMCYNDGGDRDPGTLDFTTCTDFDHFDCGHDSYFDARIGVGEGVGAGSYLDTHWNLGECYVTWIVNIACIQTGPPNDNFASAASVSATPFAVGGVDTTDATSQQGELAPNCGAIGNTVWYRYTANRDVTVTAATTGDGAQMPDSDFDTVLAAWHGNQQVACNDDIDNAAGNQRSRVQFQAARGETYYFQVGGFRDNTGTGSGLLSFNVTAIGAAPAHDNFAAARTATVPFTDRFVATDDATEEAGEPQQGCARVGRTVWYRYAPTASGRVVADTLGHDLDTPNSDFDTVLEVYQGTSLGGLAALGCSDDIDNPSGNFRSRVPFEAQAGETYYIQVGGFHQSGEAAGAPAAGTLNFSLRGAVAPPNDAFASAEPVTLPFSPLGLSTLGATREQGEPSPSCAPAGATVWYRFAPAKNMRVRASTAASDFDTVLAAYRGSAIGGLNEVGCSDDVDQATNRRSQLDIDLTTGETYYFQVGGFPSSTEAGVGAGQLVFKLSDLTPAPPVEPPVEPPVVDPPSATVRLPTGPVTVTRSGRALVRLTCVTSFGADQCLGSLLVSRHGRSVGKAQFKLLPGTGKTVRVRLAQGTRRAVRRRGRVRATLSAATTATGAAVATVRHAVTLRRGR